MRSPGLHSFLRHLCIGLFPCQQTAKLAHLLYRKIAEFLHRKQIADGQHNGNGDRAKERSHNRNHRMPAFLNALHQQQAAYGADHRPVERIHAKADLACQKEGLCAEDPLQDRKPVQRDQQENMKQGITGNLVNDRRADLRLLQPGKRGVDHRADRQETPEFFRKHSQLLIIIADQEAGKAGCCHLVVQQQEAKGQQQRQPMGLLLVNVIHQPADIDQHRGQQHIADHPERRVKGSGALKHRPPGFLKYIGKDKGFFVVFLEPGVFEKLRSILGIEAYGFGDTENDQASTQNGDKQPQKPGNRLDQQIRRALDPGKGKQVSADDQKGIQPNRCDQSKFPAPLIKCLQRAVIQRRCTGGQSVDIPEMTQHDHKAQKSLVTVNKVKPFLFHSASPLFLFVPMP